MSLYIYPAKIGRYYARRRVVDGVRGTLLPYTTGTFKHYTTGPRGGKALKECYRQTWWANDRVCRIKNVRYEHEDGTVSWCREFVPITADVYNRSDASEVRYRIRDGLLVEVLTMEEQ